MRQRNKRKEVMLSDDEWRKVENKIRYYGFKDYSTFARKSLLNKTIIIESVKDKNEIVGSISKIGTNINQAVAAINKISKKTIADKKDILEVRYFAMQIQKQQEELIGIVKDRLYVNKEEE